MDNVETWQILDMVVNVWDTLGTKGLMLPKHLTKRKKCVFLKPEENNK